jgi:hypothetical protein
MNSFSDDEGANSPPSEEDNSGAGGGGDGDDDDAACSVLKSQRLSSSFSAHYLGLVWCIVAIPSV